jgi:predicted ABC-type ATPase
MAASASPALHVIAGPNGAGKSTFYANWLSGQTDAEFVNADLLAREALGRHSLTQADAELGQDLANARRAALLEAHESFVTESTFSHPSKLELIRDARTVGYFIAVYHIGVESADLAVERVIARHAQGGHSAPEDRVRKRYERNGPLIREAVRLADRGAVFDNSVVGAKPGLLLAFRNARLIRMVQPLPVWAQTLYGPDLKLWPGTLP